MSPSELAFTALQGVQARPWRAALTLTSLVIATLCVLVAVVGGALMRSAARESFDRQGGLVATVSAEVPTSELSAGGASRLLALARRLAPSDAEVNIQVGSDAASVLVGSGRSSAVRVSAEQESGNVVLRDLVDGRWLKPSDRTMPMPAVVLNQAAADSLGRPSTVRLRLGRSFGPQSFHVVGRVADGADATVYVQLDDARVAHPGFVNDPSSSGRIRVHGRSEDNARLARAAGDSVALLGPRISRPDLSQADGGRSVTAFVDRLEQIAVAIAAVMVAVAVLGVLNIGLASLRERSDELALRRGFGASRLDVALIVLAEAALLAIVATVVAIGLSLVAYVLVGRAGLLGPRLDLPSYPRAAAAVGSAVATGAGLLGAVVPALRAGRIAPAEVMRA